MASLGHIFCAQVKLFALYSACHCQLIMEGLEKINFDPEQKSGASNQRAIDFQILSLIELCLEMQGLLCSI